jgi:hypothetical protein
MSTINSVHTPCKNCVFAKYEDNTQIDCHLSYIEKYRNKNIEIVEAYDENKEFYIINNKKCIGYRENSWFEKRKLEHLSIEEKIQKFQEKNFIHYLLVIDLKHIGLNNIDQLISELKKLSIKPRKIIFVRYQNDDNRFSYETIKNILLRANLDCKWRVQTMLVEKYVLDEVVVTNKKYRFVLSVTQVSTNMEDIINRANTTVYEDMERFVVIRNKDRSYVLFSTLNYRYSLIVEKKDILEEDKDHIII